MCIALLWYVTCHFNVGKLVLSCHFYDVSMLDHITITHHPVQKWILIIKIISLEGINYVHSGEIGPMNPWLDKIKWKYNNIWSTNLIKVFLIINYPSYQFTQYGQFQGTKTQLLTLCDEKIFKFSVWLFWKKNIASKTNLSFYYAQKYLGK